MRACASVCEGLWPRPRTFCLPPPGWPAQLGAPIPSPPQPAPCAPPSPHPRTSPHPPPAPAPRPPAPPRSARSAGGLPRTADGRLDYSKDFFSKPAYLTVSGQLNGEYYACALSNIYTFGEACRGRREELCMYLSVYVSVCMCVCVWWGSCWWRWWRVAGGEGGGDPCLGGGRRGAHGVWKPGACRHVAFRAPALLTPLLLATHTRARAHTHTHTRAGPTFRAENSHTARHLAEFWMIEPEMAFCDLAGEREVCVRACVRVCARPAGVEREG